MDAVTRALLRRQLADQLAHVRLLQDRGDLAQALTAVGQLLDVATGNGFGNGATVWTARRLQAELLYELGHTGKAQRLATALLQQLAITLPPGHPAIIRTTVLLAGICHEQGDLDLAEQLCHQALATQPPPEPDAPPARRRPARRALLLAQTHLALISGDRGDTAAAVDQLTQTLQQFQDRYGGRDLDTIRICAHLADLHTAAGQPEQARRLLVRALHDACARYGPTHPVSTRLDGMLSAVEPPLPAADLDQQPSKPERLIHKPKHAATPTSDTVSTPAPPDQPGPSANDQHGSIQHEHHPPAPAHAAERRSVRRHLARAAWSLAAIAGLATAGIGLQALRQPVPPASAQSTNTPLSSPSVDTNPVAANLAIRRGAQPRQIVVTWTDTSGGTATPILSITDPTGQAIATVTLPPGTERYQRDHLNPRTSYCVMLALFTSKDDTAAVGQQACLPNP